MKATTYLEPEDVKSINIQYETLTYEQAIKEGIDNVDITWVSVESPKKEKLLYWFATKKK